MIKIVADFETSLGAKMVVGATTGTLVSNVDDDGVTLGTGTYYFTIDGNNSAKEHIKCTNTAGVLTAVYSVSRQGIETSGTQREHRVGAKVVMTDFNVYKAYIDAATLAGISPATTSLLGGVYTTTNTASSVVVSTDDIRVPTADPTTLFVPISGGAGFISPYAGRTAPVGYLMCDGSAVSRTTYSSLLNVIAPSQTFTVTSASPGVFTATAHGLVLGDKIHLTTTGGLYSGLATNTNYYIIAAGLTADAFEVALSPGGTAINTSGSQSGVHTVYKAPWGKGDGSTTFNVPDFRSRSLVGKSATAPTTVMTWDPAQRSSNVITILDNVFPSQGQMVVLSTTGTLPTGLSPGTYYIIRVSSTSISFASSQANANAGTAISLSGDGTGVHTMIFTNRAHTVLGRVGGEESHGISVAELAAHTHTLAFTSPYNNVGVPNSNGQIQIYSGSTSTSSVGGDTLHNNMQPFAVVNWIIKY